MTFAKLVKNLKYLISQFFLELGCLLSPKILDEFKTIALNLNTSGTKPVMSYRLNSLEI
jgi:hypothetical protein